jgi:hypothetical protein
VGRRLVGERRLEGGLVSRAAALAALAAALPGAAGCFDVRSVDPGPLVIDDFDDGDLQPADPAFPPWTCFTFNPMRSDGYSCALDAGYHSDHSLVLEATIDDPPDGIQQYGGGGLATFGDAPQDLSHFRELVFAVELESGDPPLPSSTQLQIQLGCSTALADDNTMHNDLAVIQLADYDSTWQTKTLAMANFGTPFYLPTHIAGGPTACLRRIDSIQFVVQPQLPDGQSTSFTLHVDDIYFR